MVSLRVRCLDPLVANKGCEVVRAFVRWRVKGFGAAVPSTGHTGTHPLVVEVHLGEA